AQTLHGFSMFDPTKPWPFHLPRAKWSFLAACLLILLILVGLVDGPVTIWVSQSPEWVRAPFHIITRAGSSDWILLPALLLAVGFGLFGTLRTAFRERARWFAGLNGFIFAAVAVPGVAAWLIKRLLGRA